MQCIVVEGGRPLVGHVRVGGAKNAALPILLSAILNGGESVFRNVPRLMDVATTRKLLLHLGADVDSEGGTVFVDSSPIHNLEATYDLVCTMRASVLILGPLLGRFGQARVSLPGGCAIGARPVDQHIKALRALGAHIDIRHGYIYARGRRLRGALHRFDLVTVGGTEQAMMAAVLADGETVLENCAVEPEVCDLARCLVAMGARIDGIGTSTLVIRGVESLAPVDYSVIPDRIEAGTLMAATVLAGGDVTLKGVCALDNAPAIETLRAAGARIDEEVVENAPALRVRAEGRPRAFSVETAPHPGFPTDMQAQVMAVSTLASGESRFAETIFENRFLHAVELQRLGADITLVDHHTALVRGVDHLEGAPVTATDLRASAALVLAGLVARGRTVIRRPYHLDRGYEDLDGKLRGLGASIRRERGGDSGMPSGGDDEG